MSGRVCIQTVAGILRRFSGHARSRFIINLWVFHPSWIQRRTNTSGFNFLCETLCYSKLSTMGIFNKAGTMLKLNVFFDYMNGIFFHVLYMNALFSRICLMCSVFLSRGPLWPEYIGHAHKSIAGGCIRKSLLIPISFLFVALLCFVRACHAPRTAAGARFLPRSYFLSTFFALRSLWGRNKRRGLKNALTWNSTTKNNGGKYKSRKSSNIKKKKE